MGYIFLPEVGVGELYYVFSYTQHILSVSSVFLSTSLDIVRCTEGFGNTVLGGTAHVFALPQGVVSPFFLANLFFNIILA